MAIITLVLGESGTGKSASLRNFKENEVGIINVAGKPLPFKSNLKTFKSSNYQQIENVLKNAKAKILIIDDAQYLMAFEFMQNANAKGYDKFTTIANNFYELIQTAISLPDDVTVYFLAHTENDQLGNTKMKTIGKMLDEKITVEGLFTIVLRTFVDSGKYQFSTQNNGHDTVKSPMGMFDQQYIDNDLKAIDDAIRQYYDITLKKENSAKDAMKEKEVE